MDFEIRILKSNLILIRWHCIPKDQQEAGREWVKALKQQLNEASEPLYFISDLRNGYISDISVLNRASDLSKHRMWGGGVSLSTAHITSIFVDIFASLGAWDVQDGMKNNQQELVKFLEEMESGITADVDWDAVLPVEG